MDLLIEIKEHMTVYVAGCAVSALFIVMWFYLAVGIDKLSDIMLYPFKKIRHNENDEGSPDSNHSKI